MKLRSTSSPCLSDRLQLAPLRRTEPAVRDRLSRRSSEPDNSGHCFRCGTRLRLARTDETLRRLVCPSCQFVHYENPKILVGGIVTSADRILLCQRALEPSRGLWTLPAGFLERRESLEMGAVREIREETGVVIDPKRLVPYILSSLIDLQQVYVFFRVDIEDCKLCPGRESLAAAFFKKNEVPWKKLAFQGMREYVESAFEEKARKEFGVHLDDLRGSTLMRRSFSLSNDE